MGNNHQSVPSEICQAGIHAGFLASAAKHPGRPALDVAGSVLSYAELRTWAAAVASTVTGINAPSESSLVGVFALRTAAAYAAVLGGLMSGKGIVPLNPSFPPERTAAMIEASGIETLLLDSRGASQLEPLLKLLSKPMCFLFVETGAGHHELARAWPQHRFLDKDGIAAPATWQAKPVNPDSTAYLLFTSGTTGKPKGVALLHRNLTHFIRVGLSRYALSERDRFSQIYDFTWDPHLFDLYGCWESAACLCVPQPDQLLNPGKFFREKEITVIDMVPSMAHVMMRMGSLKPGRYPALRLLRLGGEAVAVEIAAACAAATPNAVVENTYGPTEATVEVTSYVWDSTRSPAEAEQGIVPIGFPYRGCELLVVDESLEEVPEGTEGELLIGGAQTAPGYWRSPEQTRRAFVVPPGREQTFYRTGDRVRRPAAGKPMCFLGRNDSQIKIHGARIELGDVEAALRKSACTALAAAVGWPRSKTGTEGIIAFIDKPGADVAAILADLKHRLPNVMVPRQVRLLQQVPLNANGKVDRNALLRLLESETPARTAPRVQSASGNS